MHRIDDTAEYGAADLVLTAQIEHVLLPPGGFEADRHNVIHLEPGRRTRTSVGSGSNFFEPALECFPEIRE